jgi:methylated-DNA-protein-cysteine methyltransferase-like protein
MVPTMRARPPAAAEGIFRAVWAAVARIPRGRVATYGQIARMTGVPGGARTVGWAMRALPDGARLRGRPVPWHRVINAQGRISPRREPGAGDGAMRQARRLRREGVAVAAGGRIDLARHLWRGDRRRR